MPGWVVGLRIFLGFIAGFAMGMEREMHQHPAGLRTIIMITVSSTLLMILSISIPAITGTGDPARIAAQVVSGIGFLGGGAILRQGLNIRGLTSAAIIWAAAAMGLSIGAGLYFAAGITFFIYIITLVSLEKLKLKLLPAEQRKFIDLEFSGTPYNPNEIRQLLIANKIAVLNTDITCNLNEKRTRITFAVDIPKELDFHLLVEQIQTIGELESLSLHG